MCTVFFRIGSITIYGYGVMMALGLISSVALGCYRAKYYRIDPDVFFNGAFWGIVFGLLGAKVMYWIVEIKSIIADPKLLLDIGSGFVVYGGLFTGILTPYIYFTLVKKGTTLDKLDLAMPSISIGQFFGRMGCLMAGCCYGKVVPTGAWYGMVFPETSSAPAGIALYPTQLMSAIGNLLLCIFLILMTNRVKYRGHVVCLYMICYSVGRFLIEYLRNDPRGNVGIFSTSQFIAIITFTAGVILWFVFKKRALPPIRRVSKEELALEKAMEDAASAAQEEV
ncbi:MAG: prolipoprotein diacylglyceryl transferase [Lachnospiraceae bacterium]|nr:prolipoprotein diacylglyceryl transferase [Lachnospiraceae bacterium]